MAIYEGSGQEEFQPFIDVLLAEECLEKDASPLVGELINLAVGQGTFTQIN
jgi:hypothetical protein